MFWGSLPAEVRLVILDLLLHTDGRKLQNGLKPRPDHLPFLYFSPPRLFLDRNSFGYQGL